MKIEFISISPNLQSINRELLLTFAISDIEIQKMPLRISGKLLSEDSLEIGNLIDVTTEYSFLCLNATGSSQFKRNETIKIILSCQLTTKAISHVENYRVTQKEDTKDIVLFARLNIQLLESNVTLTHFVEGVKINGQEDAFTVFYKYTNDYSAQKTNLWVLSGNSGPNFLGRLSFTHAPIPIKIDLMDWVNKYTNYLDIGKFIVYEFILPNDIPGDNLLRGRFEKAQIALVEMKKQLNYGEWKQAIISARPIFELFKNFSSLENLLQENGYTRAAYLDFKKIQDGFFGLLSKFYHSLDTNYTDINPEMPVEKEDAHLAYAFSMSLLHFISRKVVKAR